MSSRILPRGKRKLMRAKYVCSHFRRSRYVSAIFFRERETTFCILRFVQKCIFRANTEILRYLFFSRKQDLLDAAMVRWREIQYREYYKDRAREKLDDTPFLHLSPPQYNTKSFLLFSRLKLKFRVLKLVRNRNSLHARGLNV